MTKEEIIENLKNFNERFFGGKSQTLSEAIKVLEQPNMDKAMIHTLVKENGELWGEIGRLRQLIHSNEEQVRILNCEDIDIQKFTEAMKHQPLQVMQPSYDEVQKEKSLAFLDGCIAATEAKNKIDFEDCVSKSDVRKIAKEMYLEVANMDLDVHTISDCISYTSSKCRQVLEDKLQSLPSVTPTHKSCMDCKYNNKDKKISKTCDIGHRFFMREPSTFYCADFEKRGDENGSN